MKKGTIMRSSCAVVAAAIALLSRSPRIAAQNPVAPALLPVVTEAVSPLESIAPEARDGYRGVAFVRKPPGDGSFPAIVLIHGGMSPRPAEQLKQYALASPPSWVFLAAGYVVAVITYRSQLDDPRSQVRLEDALAAVDHVGRLAYVDPGSIGVYGCSGGGDLALEIAAASTQVRAVVAEEPASFIFAGIFNASFPKAGPRHTAADARPIGDNPKAYYTPEYQNATRAKIARINPELLIIQSDQEPAVVPFNNQVLIPELRQAGKKVEVKSFPGEPHCFAFNGQSVQPANVIKALDEAEIFFRRLVTTKPRPIDPSLIKRVSLGPIKR